MRCRILRIIAMVLFVFAVAACTTAGQKFDSKKTPEIRIGVHDKDDIRDWFGEPLSVEPLTNSARGCVERWTYAHSSDLAGMFEKSHNLVVDFYATGKVCDHAYRKLK